MGMPKALMRDESGEPWLTHATTLLHGAGCDRVVVVFGARAEEALPLVPDGIETVIAEKWRDGMAESLKCGLSVADGTAAVITLVDLPDLPASVVERVLGDPGSITGDTLRQATFVTRPGHPVVVGRNHWAPLIAQLSGDRGARAYLSGASVTEIECGDLFDGHDVDYRAEP